MHSTAALAAPVALPHQRARQQSRLASRLDFQAAYRRRHANCDSQGRPQPRHRGAAAAASAAAPAAAASAASLAAPLPFFPDRRVSRSRPATSARISLYGGVTSLAVCASSLLGYPQLPLRTAPLYTMGCSAWRRSSCRRWLPATTTST